MEVGERRGVLDGEGVRAWAAGALTACRAARERIDAVNVFPVPDADTGSNVTLTVQGGVEAVAAEPGDDGAVLLAAFARGAARAARGNSGIILSQWLVGLAAGPGAGEVDRTGGADPAGAGPAVHPSTGPGSGPAAVLVAALEQAALAARSAVPDPQEGTILTVAREVAAHARRGAGGHDAGAQDAGGLEPGPVPAPGSPAAVLAGATDAARADLGRVSAGHDVLRAAHVVDAGACALLVVLDALVHTLRTGGRALEEADVDLAWLPQAGPDVVAGCAPTAGGAFEVMMLVEPSWPGAGDLARALQAVGDAVAVADTGGTLHAHVHCDDPAAAVDLVPPAAREQVVVRRVDEPAPAARGLVVLTASPGLAAWYASCGAVTLVGPGPSVEQVARAAVDTRAGRAVVVDAGVGIAGGVTSGSPFDLLTAPADGPAVVACLALVADPHVAPEAGRQALERVRAAAAATAADAAAAVAGLVRDAPGAVAATVVHGADVEPDAARAVAAGLAGAHPQLEVVVAGPALGPTWWVGVD